MTSEMASGSSVMISASEAAVVSTCSSWGEGVLNMWLNPKTLQEIL